MLSSSFYHDCPTNNLSILGAINEKAKLFIQIQNICFDSSLAFVQHIDIYSIMIVLYTTEVLSAFSMSKRNHSFRYKTEQKCVLTIFPSKNIVQDDDNHLKRMIRQEIRENVFVSQIIDHDYLYGSSI